MAKSRQQSALRYPLSTILAGEARVSVLRELFRHGAELSAPQLVARTGLAQSSVREALILLEATQAVDVLGAGKSILYRANRRHPLRDALDAMFTAEEDRYRAVIDGIREVAGSFGHEVDAIWLFGSVARGEDGFSSDLDLAVVTPDLDGGRLLDRIRERLRPLQERLLFRVSIVGLSREDVLGLRQENPPLMHGFENDAVAIVGKRPTELLHEQETRRRTGSLV